MLPLCRRGRGEEVADEARELPAGLLAAVPEGIAVARESPGVGLLVLVLAGGAVLRGALNVLYVRLAIDDLGMGQGGAGLLNACFGLGAVAAGAGSVLLIGRRGLVGPLYLGVSVSAVALVGLSLHLDRPAAVVAMVAVGAGLALLNVTGRTFLQRITPEAVLGRVFGLLEGVWYAGSGLGSLAVPALIVLGGTRTAVFWVGMMLPVAGVFAWHVLRALDIAGPDRSAQIALLRRYPPFAVLGPPELETLAAALAPLSASPGATVIAEGERGDRFYLITSGEAVVSIGDVDVRTLGPGDGFGEIALLRDSPRTATVTATSPLSLWTLEREPFLLAITHHALAQHAADRHVTVLSGS